MGLENATYVSGLNSGFPEGGDQQSQGDDHLRLIKSVLKTTFPDASKPFYFPKVSAAKSSNYSISLPGDDGALIPVNAVTGSITITLGVGSVAGQEVTVVKTDSSVNTVVISGTILGAGSSFTLRHQGAIAKLRWDHDGTRWVMIYNSRIARAGTFSLTSSTTLTISHDESLIQANATSGGFTITLPTSNIPTGYEVTIQKIDSSANIVAIAGMSSFSLYNQYEALRCKWNGSGYNITPLLWSSTEDVWAGNVDRGLRASDLTDASVIQNITFSTPTQNWSWTGGFVRELTLAADTGLAIPSGGIPGQFRTLIIKGSSSEGRELTFGSGFGGVHPTMDDITSSKWYAITIMCVTASHFIIVGLADASPPS